MEAYTHCQSCGMPLDDAGLLGTEKDGQRWLGSKAPVAHP